MINIDRLMHDIETMATIGALPDGGVRRTALSEEDRQGRVYLASRLRAAGLEVYVDPVGNIVGRREPDDPGADGAAPPRTILVGSHIDSIERGGRFDGVLGVFGALECVRSLNDAGVSTTKPIEVIAFTDEEERFFGFLGSYALTGEIGYEEISGCTDNEGIRLVDAMAALGLDAGRIREARRDLAGIGAFLELHIEQGPILEREGASVGLVQSVKGDYRWRVTVTGRTDHAGSPRAGRQDAVMAMHAVMAHLIAFRDREGDDDATLTFGRISVEPNIETAQAGKVVFTVDFRSPRGEFLDAADGFLLELLETTGRQTGQRVEREPILIEKPVAFDPTILSLVEASAVAHEYPYRALYSGAGHDAQVLGRHVPTAMIFVPSAGGRSHCPEEFTKTEDIERGVTVLYDTLRELATR